MTSGAGRGGRVGVAACAGGVADALGSGASAGGVAGGANGRGGRFVVRLGEADERETRASGRYEMKAGDRFLLQSAGGGGYGDPRERDEARLRADVAEGYVTREAARSVYGKEV